MAFENIRKQIADFVLTKAQKAQYVVSSKTADKAGEPVPNKYSPEVRERLYKTPLVFTSINAIADQVAKVDWEIVPKKNLLEQLGYGTDGGKSLSVLTMKQWARFSTKYTSADRNKLDSSTKNNIAKIYALFDNPNENMESFASIIKKLATDLKIHDAAALEKIRNGMNDVVEIYTAPAPYIRMNFDKNGKLLNPAYIQLDPKFINAKVAEWNKEELIYFMLNPISTSMYGISPIDVIAQVVATLINALNYNGTYFESAAMPEGFFTLPGLSEVAARRLMQKWEQDIKKKAHKILFMPEGATWHQFRFTNVEMQWLQGQKFYNELVMAVLGVTKHELGFTEDVNRATADNQSFVFKNKSLLPILSHISDKINQELIGQYGFGFSDVMFVFKNVDLADKETMDKIHDRAVKSGRMTINEAREEAGKSPYEKVGDAPVIATSQGLVFLEQYEMQFEDYKEERDMLKVEAKKRNMTVGELKQERQQQQAAQNGKNIQNDKNNSDKQPARPPSAPKADQQPLVDESKKSERAITMVAGLERLEKKIDKAIEDYDNATTTKDNSKRDQESSKEAKK